MQANIKLSESLSIKIDLSKPLSIAIDLNNGIQNPNCFWAPFPEFSPVVMGDFVGSTEKGGIVNFKNVKINPHGNGTHTECVGHISIEPNFIKDCLKDFTHLAQLISIYPSLEENGDRVIHQHHLEAFLEEYENHPTTALIIRTLPNDSDKLNRNYSGSNPTYMSHEAASMLVERGIEHLLIDLPSIDREEDEGKLLAHRAFWQYPGEQVRKHCTISELIFVPSEIMDGFYVLQHQITPIQLDASPSNPVLYQIIA